MTGTPWLPPIDYVPLWKDPLHNLSIVLLPAITVGYRYSAVTMRLTRSAMLEVMREDYIRTARAKGLLEQIVVNRHALKNALLPVVTLIGIEFAFLIGGLVVTEQVFNLNGIGRLLVQAVQNQDNVLAQALVMLVVRCSWSPTSWSTCCTPGSTRASATREGSDGRHNAHYLDRRRRCRRAVRDAHARSAARSTSPAASRSARSA